MTEKNGSNLVVATVINRKPDSRGKRSLCYVGLVNKASDPVLVSWKVIGNPDRSGSLFLKVRGEGRIQGLYIKPNIKLLVIIQEGSLTGNDLANTEWVTPNPVGKTQTMTISFDNPRA